MRLDPIAFRLLFLVALTAFLSNPMTGRAQEDLSYDRIAAFAHGSPMITVGEGFFFMGTARTGHDLYSLDLLTMIPNNHGVACGWISLRSIETRSALGNFYWG